jgi:hypothetical protein
MKKLKIMFACGFVLFTYVLHAQTPTPTPAQQVASRIAIKMKDTLGLNVNQQTQIYTINLNINNRKMMVRQQFTNVDSIRIKTQRIERSRDLLYQAVLPPPKYNLYLQKKRNLVTAN